MKNLAPAKPVSNTADAAIIKRYKDALSKWHRIAPETWKTVAAALGEPPPRKRAGFGYPRGRRKKRR
jgi:hypothetical protein